MKWASLAFCLVLTVPLCNGANPSAVSVTPASGSGLSQTFNFVFTAPNGAADIYATYMEISVAGIGEPHGCMVLYLNPANSALINSQPSPSGLILLSDDNFNQQGTVLMGSNQAVSNSQCTISGSGGVPTSSGNNLTVPVAITFKPPFNGRKNIFGFAENRQAMNNGSQLLGTWTPSEPALVAVSIARNMGGGPSPTTFPALFSDANGASDIQAVYLVFTTGASQPATNACFVAYVPASNQLYLFNDADNGVAPGSPITEGSTDTVQNSRCILSGSGGTATLSGNNLTVPVKLTFLAPDLGVQQTMYGLVQRYESAPAAQSPWANLGTWTPTAPTG